MNKYEFMFIWWVGIPLYVIAIVLLFILIALKNAWFL